MKIKKSIFTLLWMLLCSFIGLIVFSVTLVALNRDRNYSHSLSISTITEKDSCTFYASNEILELNKESEGIILYLETKPCAICSENAIMDIAHYMQDSLIIRNPILLFHPITDIDSIITMGYHERFDKYFKVVVTREDSIMIKNPWMSEFLGFYGIVTDSMSRVQYAGSLFDPEFLACCKRQFGKSD